LFILKNTFEPFIHFLVLVEVIAKALKNNDNVLSKLERVDIFHEAVLTLVISFISFCQLVQNFYLHVSVVNVKFFVFAEFNGNSPLVRVLVVEALDHLSESPLVYYSDNLVPIGYLLADFGQILTIFISD
jgi:hypothetical protein